MSFPLVGNDRVRDALTAAVSQDHLPHAILIEGDAGTGRHTLARYLAAACVCERHDPPCGECRGCHLAQVGTHPDIAVTAPEDNKKNISVAQIRSLRAEAYIKPHLANHRVFVIDGADSMNEQAQNALLKVLEEPPGAAVFVLIALSKAALLATVLSRCTVLSLSPPGEEDAIAYLLRTTSYDDETVRTALKESGGNIGAALAFLNGSGTASRAAAERFLQAFLNEDEWGMLQCTVPFEKNRVEAERFCKQLRVSVIEALRDNLRYPHKAAALARFADELPAFEQSLQTNVNLNLLFCALVCKAAASLKK